MRELPEAALNNPARRLLQDRMDLLDRLIRDYPRSGDLQDWQSEHRVLMRMAGVVAHQAAADIEAAERSDPRPASDGGTCPHTDTHLHLNTASFGNTNIRYLEISGRCTICEAPMRFRGRAGMSPNEPGIAIDGSEIRLPLMFGDEEYDGKATGYSITIAAGEI